jgi:hypothetical protein
LGSCSSDDYGFGDGDLGGRSAPAQYDFEKQPRFNDKYKMSKSLRIFLDERGSVESHLVLIPLTILFLLTLQLSALGSWWTGSLGQLQGSANTHAISALSQDFGDSQIREELLRGGGRLTVIEFQRRIPLLANFARLLPGVSPEKLILRERVFSFSEY